MKTRLGKIFGIFAASTIALALQGAPAATAIVPPPGGALSPGPIGGQLSPQGVGGQLKPGNDVIAQPPLAGTPASGIPGGALYVGSNGIMGNPALSQPGGTLNRNGVGGTASNRVIVAGRAPLATNGAVGGTLSGNGVGGSNHGVIVAGPPNNTTPPAGGTISPGTGGTLTPGTTTTTPSSGVIVAGGSGQ